MLQFLRITHRSAVSVFHRNNFLPKMQLLQKWLTAGCVDHPEKPGHCVWKAKLLMNFLNAMSHCCSRHKQNSIHLRCISVAGEISEMDILKPG